LRQRVVYARSLFYLATIGYTSCQLVDRIDVATHLTIHTHSSSATYLSRKTSTRYLK